jgi:hypothetical protein
MRKVKKMWRESVKRYSKHRRFCSESNPRAVDSRYHTTDSDVGCVVGF